jgi:hypothetical protein
VARLVLVAALALCATTACSSSKESAAPTTSTRIAPPVKSPITVRTPVPNSQWRSPISVRGISGLSGELTVELLSASGKRLGSKQTAPSNGGFSVQVPFTVKRHAPAALLVHDESRDHSVQIPVVLTP